MTLTWVDILAVLVTSAVSSFLGMTAAAGFADIRVAKLLKRVNELTLRVADLEATK